MIEREKYMSKLHSLKDKNLIKVATGIRRAGKSTLFQMFSQELINKGVNINAIQYINFEDPTFYRPNDWLSIYNQIVKNLQKNQKNYIFLDEIQNIKEFERLTDGLFIHKDIDLYITGSNAYFLSGDLATLLSGRYIEINVLPLSFSEYIKFFENDKSLTNSDKFEQYLRLGGFPEVANLLADGLTLQVPHYLQTIYNTVVTKDIIKRNNFKLNEIFDNVLHFTLDSIGSSISVNNIKNAINATKQYTKQVSLERIDNYMQALIDGYILLRTKRFDIKGKKIFKTLNKYYSIDTGLRNNLLGKDASDNGHLLENIVYLELIRRENRVFVGKINEKEVDFVAQTLNGYTEYYQVAETLLDKGTRERELASLYKINNHNPKYIITRDLGDKSYDGIRQINIIDWLLNN
jgi:predicted AAA+ superfamily ATPase